MGYLSAPSSGYVGQGLTLSFTDSGTAGDIVFSIFRPSIGWSEIGRVPASDSGTTFFSYTPIIDDVNTSPSDNFNAYMSYYSSRGDSASCAIYYNPPPPPNSPPTTPSNVNCPNSALARNNTTVSWTQSTDTNGDSITYIIDFFNGTTWISCGTTGALNFLYSLPDIETTNAKFRVSASDGKSVSGYGESPIFKIYRFSLYMKVNGEKKQFKDGFVKVDGSLRKISSIWIRENGNLRRI